MVFSSLILFYDIYIALSKFVYWFELLLQESNFGRAKNMSSFNLHVARSLKRCADINQRYLTNVPSHYENNEKVLIR